MRPRGIIWKLAPLSTDPGSTVRPCDRPFNLLIFRHFSLPTHPLGSADTRRIDSREIVPRGPFHSARSDRQPVLRPRMIRLLGRPAPPGRQHWSGPRSALARGRGPPEPPEPLGGFARVARTPDRRRRARPVKPGSRLPTWPRTHGTSRRLPRSPHAAVQMQTDNDQRTRARHRPTRSSSRSRVPIRAHWRHPEHQIDTCWHASKSGSARAASSRRAVEAAQRPNSPGADPSPVLSADGLRQACAARHRSTARARNVSRDVGGIPRDTSEPETRKAPRWAPSRLQVTLLLAIKAKASRCIKARENRCAQA